MKQLLKFAIVAFATFDRGPQAGFVDDVVRIAIRVDRERRDL